MASTGWQCPFKCQLCQVPVRTCKQLKCPSIGQQLRLWYIHNFLGGSKGRYAECKEPVLKGHTEYDPTSKANLKGQKCRWMAQISGCQGLGRRLGLKRGRKRIPGMEPFWLLTATWSQKPTRDKTAQKKINSHTHTHRMHGQWVKPTWIAGSYQCPVLAVIVQLNKMLPLYWVKDTQDLSELFLTIACQSVITSKYKVFFAFLGSHMQHMEVPSLGVKSERQLLAYTTATSDLNHIYDLCHSSGQHQIPDH